MGTIMFEGALALGCLRWVYKRCTYIGAYDSESWASATPEQFSPVPRICRLLLAVYEEDLENPDFAPEGGYGLDLGSVVKRVDYDTTRGHAPPYMVYVDHENGEIVVLVRGLNMGNQCDYKVLLNNRLGMQMFDGGYVHHGLLKSAVWLFNEECETIRRLWINNGSKYKIIFAGHSLGSGVAALLTVIAANHRDQLGGIRRENIRCYAAAPVRCMSLNLAVKYADLIHSVVLQDDFLPRTPTPLEDMFKSVFCLPCLLFTVCMTDTFTSQRKKIADPRRLYAPGRMFHIVERKFCRIIESWVHPDRKTVSYQDLQLDTMYRSCGRYPPEVKTAIPIEGRFEHVVLSCNATSDHSIIWIEREAEKALQIMEEDNPRTVTTAPTIQRLQRMHTLERERMITRKDVGLNLPQDMNTSEESSLTSKEGLSENESPKPLERLVVEFCNRDDELLLKKCEISPR